MGSLSNLSHVCKIGLFRSLQDRWRWFKKSNGMKLKASVYSYCYVNVNLAWSSGSDHQWRRKRLGIISWNLSGTGDRPYPWRRKWITSICVRRRLTRRNPMNERICQSFTDINCGHKYKLGDPCSSRSRAPTRHCCRHVPSSSVGRVVDTQAERFQAFFRSSRGNFRIPIARRNCYLIHPILVAPSWGSWARAEWSDWQRSSWAMAESSHLIIPGSKSTLKTSPSLDFI
jgi:hypothetical protein